MRRALARVSLGAAVLAAAIAAGCGWRGRRRRHDRGAGDVGRGHADDGRCGDDGGRRDHRGSGRRRRQLRRGAGHRRRARELGGGARDGRAAAAWSSGGLPADKTDLVVLNEDIAPSLDYDGAASANPYHEEVIANLMEGLVEYPCHGPERRPDPELQRHARGARRRSSRSRGPWARTASTWTVKLKQGVKSCAGNEMTADDVVYTFARAKSVSGAAPVGWFLGNVAGIFDASPLAPDATDEDKALKDEVVKVDPYTVTFKQMAPNELWPKVSQIFALYIFDSKEMQAHATDDDPWSHTYTETENSPGFGAYCLTGWDKGSQMVLEANPNYHMGPPRFTKVTIRKVPSVANRLAAIQNGEADIATQFPPKELANVAQSPNVSILGWVNNETTSLGLNFALEPWSLPGNDKLRQADRLRAAVRRDHRRGLPRPGHQDERHGALGLRRLQGGHPLLDRHREGQGPDGRGRLSRTVRASTSTPTAWC